MYVVNYEIELEQFLHLALTEGDIVALFTTLEATYNYCENTERLAEELACHQELLEFYADLIDRARKVGDGN